MINFNISFKNGKKIEKQYESREQLLATEEIKNMIPVKLSYTVKQVHIEENLITGEVRQRIVGADLNPYGWRKMPDQL